MYNAALLKVIIFDMHRWVMGAATLVAHQFIIYVFNVYSRVEIANYHSCVFVYCFTLYYFGPPCVINFILSYLQQLQYMLSQYTYTFTHLECNFLKLSCINCKRRQFMEKLPCYPNCTQVKNMTI